MPDTLLWQAMIWVLIFLRILRDNWVPRVPSNSGHNPPINLSLPNPSIPPHPLGMPHHPHVSASPTHVLCKLRHLRDNWVPRVPSNSGHNPPINLSLPNPSIPPHPLGMPHHPHVSASPTHVLCKLRHLHPPPPCTIWHITLIAPVHFGISHPLPCTFYRLAHPPSPPLNEGGMPKWAVG